MLLLLLPLLLERFGRRSGLRPIPERHAAVRCCGLAWLLQVLLLLLPLELLLMPLLPLLLLLPQQCVPLPLLLQLLQHAAARCCGRTSRWPRAVAAVEKNGK